MHVDAALAQLAAAAAFPPLRGVIAIRPATLSGPWAARQQVAAAPAPALSADAEDVAPRLPAASATPYILPARREGATPAILAGCALAYPTAAQPQPAACPAPYVPPHCRTIKQQAAAAEAGRPGRICAFPCLTAGPLPQPSAEVPLPLYRLALLYPSQRFYLLLAFLHCCAKQCCFARLFDDCFFPFKPRCHRNTISRVSVSSCKPPVQSCTLQATCKFS